MEAETRESGPSLTVVGSTMIDQIAYAERLPDRGDQGADGEFGLDVGCEGFPAFQHGFDAAQQPLRGCVRG